MQCQYIVGACGRCDIVLSSRLPRECWPGSSRRPSPRHPAPPDLKLVFSRPQSCLDRRFPIGVLSGTKIASQNRSDHGGSKRARNHSAAEIAGFFASAAAKKSVAASDFGGLPQNRRKLAATTAASSRSRAILRPQRPRDTKLE